MGLLNSYRPKGLFDVPTYGTPPISDPTNGAGGYIPDQMPAIQQALQDNAAITPQAPKIPMWQQFVGNALGYFGDNLSGESAFGDARADQMRQQDMIRRDEAKRRQEMADAIALYDYKRNNPTIDTPGIADEVNWFQNLPPERRQQAQDYMKLRYPGQFVPPAPVVMEPGDTISGMGGMGGAPPVGTIQGGMRFKGGNHRDPGNWEPVSGGPGASPGTFP